MTDDASIQAVLAQRARSNRAIAARDAEGVVSCMLPEVNVAVAGGPTLVGPDASRDAFAAQFADPTFRGYVRTADTVTVQQGPLRAVELGHWVGRWHTRQGLHEMRGTYTAEWRYTAMGWLLLSEAFTSV